MGIRRTDLAVEAEELWRESAGQTTLLPGVEAAQRQEEGIPVTTVRVLNRAGEDALGKPAGVYVTLDLRGMAAWTGEELIRCERVLSTELRYLVDKSAPEGLVLCVGLGNRAITPDAVGPLAHGHTLVTRHLTRQMPELFSGLRPVASVAAEVLGTTGMESFEVVQALCRQLRPACVIAVDALASRSMDRLCSTVQLSDTGIVPGSGVDNHRAALDRNTLGIPVIAVGVPTVVDGATLAADLTGAEEPPELGRDLFVTPRDIDSCVQRLGRLIGRSISLALQPDLSREDLESLLGGE